MHLKGTSLLALILTGTAFGQMGRYFVDRENAIGNSYAKEILKQAPAVDNQVAQTYVANLGARLVAHLNEKPFTYKFTVVQAPDAREALAAPGGHIFLPAHLLRGAQNEDEVSGLLAHALAHFGMRHSARFVARQRVTIASIPLIYMGAANPHTLLPRSMIEPARAFELEADEEGARLMAAAGYNPRAWARYLERAPASNVKPEFSPLPPLQQRLARIAAVQAAASQPPLGGLQAVQESLRQYVPARRPPTLRRAENR